MMSTHCVQNDSLNKTHDYNYYNNALDGYLIFKAVVTAAANCQIWFVPRYETLWEVLAELSNAVFH